MHFDLLNRHYRLLGLSFLSSETAAVYHSLLLRLLICFDVAQGMLTHVDITYI